MGDLRKKANVVLRQVEKEEEKKRKEAVQKQLKYVKDKVPSFYSFCADRIEYAATNGKLSVKIFLPDSWKDRVPDSYQAALSKETRRRLENYYRDEEDFLIRECARKYSFGRYDDGYIIVSW